MEMVELIREAYIRVMGVDKWDSLTDEQKHDAVMTIAKDVLNNYEK